MKNEVRICFVKMLERIKDETQNTEYVETFTKVMEILDEDSYAGTVFDAAFELHECNADKKMPVAVLEFLKMTYEIGIDDGHPICMNNMGCLYYTDRCGMKDYKKAMKYYIMAADKGYPLAANTLGFMYYYGLGVEIDYERAYKYFSMAALLGDLEAMYKTGDMFRYGYYVQKSPQAAFRLYSMAYDLLQQSDDDARCGGYILKRMGDALSEGIGIASDPSTALLFYQRAEKMFYDQIRNGDPYAQKDLERAKKMQSKLRKEIVKSLPSLSG